MIYDLSNVLDGCFAENVSNLHVQNKEFSCDSSASSKLALCNFVGIGKSEQGLMRHKTFKGLF